MFNSQKLYSQEYAGKDFWVTFMDLDNFCFPPSAAFTPPATYWYDTLELYVSSPYNAKVIVHSKKESMPGSGADNAKADTVYLTPNKAKYIKVNFGLSNRFMFSDLVLGNGVHIFSDSNIYVQAVNKRASSKGVTMVIPSASIPNAPEYIISTNQSDNIANCFTTSGFNPSSSSEFAIVGIAAVSVIEIIPRSKSLNTGTVANKPIVITLKQGETYFYLGSTDNNGAIDLSGTIIRSKTQNSKYSVFAGNKLTSSPFRNSSNNLCSSKDHVYEQLWPTVNWGKDYTAIPYKNNAGGYYIKCIAAEENTSIQINGSNYATINSGQFVYYNTNTDSLLKIISDKPISVVQFSKSSPCNAHPSSGSQLGNLSMMQLAPDNQMGTSTMFNRASIMPFSTSPGAPERYVNILIKTVDTSLFKLNGYSLPNLNWKQSNQASNFSYAQLTLDTFTYRLTCINGFISYNYGYAKNEGYSYTSTAKFEILQNNFIYNIFCKNDTTTFTALLTPNYSNPQWRIEGVQNILSGNIVRQDFKDTGWKLITLYFTHNQSNIVDSITKKIYITIADQRPVLSNDTLICGEIGFIMAARYLQYFKSYLWNGGHPFYAQYIKNPGLYWVKVTERNGCSYTDSFNVTNTPNPIADFAVSDTLFCFNKNKELQFRNLSSSPVDSIISQQWYFGDSTEIDTSIDTLYHTYKKHGNYKVRLKLTTDKGCSDDTIIQVKILNSPKAEFTITNKDTCLYTNAFTFNNLTKIDTAEHIGFKWYFSTGDSIINSNPSGVQSYNFADNYNAKLIYYHANGCFDTMSQDYAVYENLVADFDHLNNTICDGDSVHFNNKTQAYNLPYTSMWSFGDLNTSSLKSPVYLYGNKGQYSVKLKVESAVACSDSIVKIIYINAATIADFSISDTLLCLENNVFTVRDLSTGEINSAMQRIWKFSDGTQIPNFTVYDKNFIQTGKYTIQLNVINDIGCKDSIIKAVEVINDIPGIIQINDASQCEDLQDFDFRFIKGNTNDSILSYKWYYSGDSSTTSYLDNVTFIGNGNQSIRLKIAGSSGCTSNKFASVIINPKPNASFNLNKSEMCFKYNSFTFFNNSTINSGRIAQYIWNYGDNSSSSLKDPASKSYTNSGKYSMNLICISDSGCRDTISDSIVIHPNPQINISPISTVCLNDSSLFNVQTSISTGSIVFSLWKLGDNNISNQNTFKHAYKENGLYQVSYITATDKGCLDTVRTTANVLQLPKADFRYNFVDLGNDRTKVSFFNTSSISDKVFWEFGGFSTSRKNDTILEFNDSQTFNVRIRVTDRNGCSGYKDEIIFVGNTLKFFMPNVFSPNGDSHNDGFGPGGIEFTTDYKFVIFNRWGEIMFQTNNPNEKWDGTYKGELCPNGVYIYIVELRDFFYQYDDFKGSFLLMR